jgi:hypothetical protein
VGEVHRQGGPTCLRSPAKWARPSKSATPSGSKSSPS